MGSRARALLVEFRNRVKCLKGNRFHGGTTPTSGLYQVSITWTQQMLRLPIMHIHELGPWIDLFCMRMMAPARTFL